MMSRRRIWLAAVALALCGGVAGPGWAQTLKIGYIGPLTGPGAQWGLAGQEGTRVLASRLNEKGGVEIGGNTYKVDVISYDDKYKAADAVAAYNRLVNVDGVKYILTMTSTSTLALADMVENDKVIMLSTAGVEKSVNPNSRYMFRPISLVKDYVPALVDWLKANVPGRKVAVVNPNDEVGWNSNNIATENYRKSGYDVVAAELYERTQKDFQPLLTKVLALKPDLIELASSAPATSGLIVRQARELGYKGPFVKNSGAAIREIIEAAGKDGAEGVISLHFGNPDGDAYKQMAEVYRKTYGQQPDDFMIIFYDAANILVNAIQKSGGVDDPDKVSKAIFTQPLPRSVQGDDLTIGGHGRPGSDNQIMTYSFISQVKNGEPVIVAKVK